MESNKCGLCPLCSKALSDNLPRTSPGDRGRRDQSLEKLQAMRIRYKESGQFVKALAIQSAIQELQR